ncbi:hypothetical protein ACFPM0_04705 [Pseudonocardia sulfidoxydans]|uniref:hypothetical protein n=1 Tax=Pseudonocardia sulfidoxydans TaxID=54011 RepID=UPI00361B4ED8
MTAGGPRNSGGRHVVRPGAGSVPVCLDERVQRVSGTFEDHPPISGLRYSGGDRDKGDTRSMCTRSRR